MSTKKSEIHQTGHHRRQRRPRPYFTVTITTATLTVAFVSILGTWVYILFISPWPQHPSSPSVKHHDFLRHGMSSSSSLSSMLLPASENGSIQGMIHPHDVTYSFVHREKYLTVPQIFGNQVGVTFGKGYSSLEHLGYSWRPRVVGVYAFEIGIRQSKDLHDREETEDEERDMDNSKRIEVLTSTHQLPQYVYLTERIDPYLLSYTSQTLRRIRVHDRQPNLSYSNNNMAPYVLAIANSNADVKAVDPLTQLMLSADSRQKLSDIRDNSEEYANELPMPLQDGKCVVSPKNSKWMLASFPTCNLLHEFDTTQSLRNEKTKIVGSGYWRDVWRVMDSAPSVRTQRPFSRKKRRSEWKKIALKTLCYGHEFTEYNYDRHRRDALVSERLTHSPHVVSMFGFCGNSGFFEYASGGSLGDRLYEHYMAMMDAESRENLGRGSGNSDYSKPLDSYAKLDLAHQVAVALADTHDADALRDRHGKITSAAIVHADITPDQFINVGGVYKLNDFNRCRFMRQYFNSTGAFSTVDFHSDINRTSEGDGKPCGFFVENNPSTYRSPEEYAYAEETEKIDVYSMGNIFYSLLTDLDPWEETTESNAQQLVLKGKRPEVPQVKAQSVDFVDMALREVMYLCWEHDPAKRPRARNVANFLSKKLTAFNSEHRQ